MLIVSMANRPRGWKKVRRKLIHVLEGLHQAGINLDALTQELEDEGVKKFSEAFEQLMAALQEKRAA